MFPANVKVLDGSVDDRNRLAHSEHRHSGRPTSVSGNHNTGLRALEDHRKL